MPSTVQILFSTEHLFHPLRAQNAKGPKNLILDRIISGVALMILGALSLGIIPALYGFAAKKKSNPFIIPTARSIATTKALKEKLHNPILKKMVENPQSEAEFVANKAVSTPVFTAQLSALPKGSNSYLSFIHSWGGSRLFPASDRNTTNRLFETRRNTFKTLSLDPNQFFRRESVACDGMKIDIYLFGKKSTLGNGRWTLLSHGYTGHAENANGYQKDVFERVHSNYVVFNYPNMSCTEGNISRNNVVAAYRAVLNFIEEGIGAKEIICWGTSMGGGVKGHAFKRHKFKPNIKYVSVSDQTYTTLEKAAKAMNHGWGATAIKKTGWQLSSKKSSPKLPYPEIVIHKAKQLHPKSFGDIEHDNLFGGEDCLAGHLLKQKEASQWTTKKFIGTKAHHCGGLNDDEKQAIADAINAALQ